MGRPRAVIRPNIPERSDRNEGEPVRTVHLEQGTRPRRLFFLIAVSAAIESFALPLVRPVRIV